MKNKYLGALIIFCCLFTVSVSLAEEKKASGAVELSDPVGDLGPIGTTDGDVPPLDIVHLSLKSDAKQIAIAASLNEPPGNHATSVVTLYIDTDNNSNTGAALFSGPKGFEYKVDLEACIDYTDGGSACIGGSKNSTPQNRFAAIDVERFKGTNEHETDHVVDSMGFPGRKASSKTPIQGKIVQSAVDYGDLNLKPGQTIRIVARESGGNPQGEDKGFFPDIILTLK